MKTKDNFAEFSNPDTIIGEGVEVQGTLKTLGDIQINGTFKGKLTTEGDVIIGEHAHVEADISAQNVHVAGCVLGNVSAIHKLEVFETGEIKGNVSSSALVIEAGGVLKGSSKMQETESERPSIDPTYEVEEETEVSA